MLACTMPRSDVKTRKNQNQSLMLSVNSVSLPTGVAEETVAVEEDGT